MIFPREDKLLERAKALKVNAGTEPDADIGPVISKQVHTWFTMFTNRAALYQCGREIAKSK